MAKRRVRSPNSRPGYDQAMGDGCLIAIASYRRPEGLRRLLDSLQRAIGSMDVDILVVDNDSEESARPIAAGHSARPVYVVEPAPGIAEARNRALQHFDDRYRSLVFVDDDEWVSPSWLETLTAYAGQTGAGVVTGPVESVFPAPPPDWVRRGGFIQRPILRTGRDLPWAATNNTLLLREAWLRAGSPRFDPAFSVTGGSDADFFRGIAKSGVRILYCAEALVFEEVTPDRVSLRWVRRRAIRTGMARTRVWRKHRDPLWRGLGGVALRAGAAALFLAVRLASGHGPQARAYNSLFHAYGCFAALFRYRINVYERPAPAASGGRRAAADTAR
jgi:glycosyltransferase involved in cell wall biosynthesis